MLCVKKKNKKKQKKKNKNGGMTQLNNFMNKLKSRITKKTRIF